MAEGAAEAAAACFSEDDFYCPVCQEVFKTPVRTANCQHVWVLLPAPKPPALFTRLPLTPSPCPLPLCPPLRSAQTLGSRVRGQAGQRDPRDSFPAPWPPRGPRRPRPELAPRLVCRVPSRPPVAALSCGERGAVSSERRLSKRPPLLWSVVPEFYCPHVT